MKPVKSRAWSTFLRIQAPTASDRAPALDVGWCAAKGVNTGAATVLRLLRDEVVPLVRRLERKHGLQSYHFLVHDRQSGVPAPEGDRGDFIHLNLFFKKAIDLRMQTPSNFEFTRSRDTDSGFPGGIDGSIVKGSPSSVRKLIDMQSAWVLALVEAHDWKDDAEMVRQVLQFGHFFSNMLQMRFA